MFLKLETEENKPADVRQRKYCVELLQQKERQYRNNLPIISCSGEQYLHYLLKKSF